MPGPCGRTMAGVQTVNVCRAR